MTTVIKSTFCKSESPEYNVVKTHDRAYEERRYGPSVWVSTSTILNPVVASDHGSTTKKSDDNEPYCKLFGYIKGQNEGNHSVEMTFPVTNEYTTDHSPKGESKRTMSYFVPKKFEEKTPLPNDPEIYISQRPAMTVYAIKFRGFASDEKCMNKEKFLAILEADGVRVKRDRFFCAFYNTPFRLINRRNEIWLVKEMEESKCPSPSHRN